MNKNTVLFLCVILITKNFVFSDDMVLKEAKESVISSHVVYSKLAIDHKCQKLKRKIRELENNLDYYNSNQSLNHQDKQQRKILKEINYYENKIQLLKSIKYSVDIIDFNSL